MLVFVVTAALVVWPIAGAVGPLGTVAAQADDGTGTVGGSDTATSRTAGGGPVAEGRSSVVAQQASPVEIGDWNDLDTIRNDLDGDYVLVADLNETTPGYDEVAGPNANDGSGFQPIGNDSARFSGTLDGDGHEIVGLSADRPDTTPVGLIGSNHGSVTDLVLSDVDLNGNNQVGAAAGRNSGTVANVRVSGVLNASFYTGGVAGSNSGLVNRTTVSGTIEGRYGGGVVGVNNDEGVVRQSNNTASIRARQAGGVVGSNNGLVRLSSNAGTVNGEFTVGGIVGVNGNALIEGEAVTTSYNTGTVNHTDPFDTGGTGGIVGRNIATVNRSWVSAAVESDLERDVAAAVGFNDGTVSGVYYDTSATAIDDRNATGLAGSEMRGDSAVGAMDRLDFQNTWETGGQDEFPDLRVQVGADVGSGPSSRIEDWNDLDAVRNDLDGDYVLVNDLNETTPGYEDVAGPNANNGSGFESIGPLFGGTFDGDGHTISGFRDRTGRTGGLFATSNGTITGVTVADATVDGGIAGGIVGELTDSGTVSNSSVENVTVEGAFIGGVVGEIRSDFGTVTRSSATDVTLSGSQAVGGLVGTSDGVIRNGTVESDVGSDTGVVGGLVGSVSTGRVVDSEAIGNVSGAGFGVGGLVGRVGSSSTVSEVYSRGSVTGENEVGGLIGRLQESTLSVAFSSGPVDGDGAVGGLVGSNLPAGNDDSTVRDTYSSGPVTGGSKVGGLVGENLATVTDSYSTSQVTGDNRVGGLVGDDSAGSVTGSTGGAYWDTNASEQNESQGGTPLTTAEMTGDAARENMSGLDFENTWAAGGPGEYPELRALADGGPSSRIDDWNDLDAIRRNLSGDYVLANDLTPNTSGYEDVAGPEANDGSGFEPIGNGTNGFTGSFDGNGRVISGLVVNQTGVGQAENNKGLFHNLSGRVTDLALENVDVGGAANVGGLAGYTGALQNATIRNVSVAGEIRSVVGNAGGIAGTAFSGTTITNSTTAVEIDTDNTVGGLVGIALTTDVRRSQASGRISAGGGVAGGLIGFNDEVTVRNSSAAVDVAASGPQVGGLVGFQNVQSEVVDSYATGNVSGTSSVGGLVGAFGGVLNRTYATGEVTGDSNVGGLTGERDRFTGERTVRNSYWDTEATGQDGSANGTALTTAAMTGDAARGNMTGFDFENTWFVPGPDEYPRLRAFGEVEENDTEILGLEVTDIQFRQFLRDEEGRTVVVNVTNRGVVNQTENVVFSVPTEEAPVRRNEVVSTVRFRENVTFEPLETKTFEFRLPEIELGPSDNTDFEVSYDRQQGTLELTNNASRPLVAGEVIVDGTNLTDVDGLTPLSAVTSLDGNETVDPGRTVSLPTTSDAATLRVLVSERITPTLEADTLSRDMELFLLPDLVRPVPRIQSDRDPAFPVTQPVRFRVGQAVRSYFFGRGGEAVGTTPDIEWEFLYPSLDRARGRPGGVAVPDDIEKVTFTGTRVTQAFAGAGGAGASVTVQHPNQPETTFRTKPYRVGSPEQLPPILTGVDGSDGVYISDPDDDLEPDGETTIREGFDAQFLAPDQVTEVTFAPQWVDGGNVTDTNPSDGWSAEFDVADVPNDDGFGPDAELVVVAVDDEGRTVETVDLYTTDPPLWAERIYRNGGSTVGSDGGTVGEAIVIPDGGLDATVEPPKSYPVVGGKQIGLSGAIRYGVDTYQREAFAARYGDGSLSVGVPLSAVTNVNQSFRIGAAAEYGVPEWRLNGNARFYVIARTLLTRDLQIGVPGRFPAVGGQNVSASAYIGPGYGFELTLSGIRGGRLTVDEGLGYANITAGVEAAQSVAGQEVFVSVDGEIEGNGETTIDNDPDRFDDVSVAGIDFGGSLDGAVGARVSAPGIGGELTAGKTLFAAGSQDVDQPGPPFAARAGPSTVLPMAAGTPAMPLSLDQAPTPGQTGRRASYDPADGRLTDNDLNDTDPAIAGSDGDYTVAWSGQARDRPQPERREIYVREYADGSFGDRVRLTDDAAYNVDPTVARTGGTTVVAWARMENDQLDSIPAGELTFQDTRNASEIAYAINDGTGWSEPRVLTNDSRYQGSPVAAAIASGTGFVVAYERDGDFDYTTLDDETVEYTRLDAAGTPVENGTLGNGHGPRAAPTDAGAVRIGHEDPSDGASTLVVSEVDDTGVTTLREEAVDNLTTFDIAADAVAWTADGTSGSGTVTLADGDGVRTVPVGNGTTVRELRLATVGDRRLLQYQGSSPAADEAFLPNARTTYYQLFRNGSWSPPRTVEQAVDTDRTIYDHAVTTDDRSFVSVAAAVAFGQPGAVDDLFYVDHDYRPDLTVSLPQDDRATVRNATVGDRVSLDVTVANTGDAGTGEQSVLAAADGNGTVIDTVTVDPIDAGSRSTVSVTTTVPETGVVTLRADAEGELAELSEANNEATAVAQRPRLSIENARQTPTTDGLVVNATVTNAGETLVTNASVELVNGDLELERSVAGSLAPGETGSVTFDASRDVFNRSEPGQLLVRATEPAEQRPATRETLPLTRASPTIPEPGVEAVSLGNTTFVSVPITNDGLNNTRTELEVAYGDDVRTRQVCVPPATAERPTGFRRAFVTAPNLSTGQSVSVALNDSYNGTTRSVAPTDRGTVARVQVRPREGDTPPLVDGRLPTDADCDGVYEDFDGDGVVTDDDLRAFFERRTDESLRTQRPRFDANGDGRVDVHDVQTVLAETDEGDGAGGGGPRPSVVSPSEPGPTSAPGAVAGVAFAGAAIGGTAGVGAQTAATEPEIDVEDGVAVPEDGTATVAVTVPNDPVGAFNVTVRADGPLTVTDLAAVDSEYSERLADRDGGSALVAAGHGDGPAILEATLRGEATGNGTVVVDTESISDDDGTRYESPAAVSATLTVAADVDAGSGSGDSGTGSDGGSGGGTGSGGGNVGGVTGGGDAGVADDGERTVTATPERTTEGTRTETTTTTATESTTEPATETSDATPITAAEPAAEDGGTPTAAPTTTTADGPGFGLLAALVALFVAVLAARIRRRGR
ncbi:CARDB domain-containing protein [Halorientalis sp.]|uniref:CARDB domain-containing protein n=1 Tax=Halorientalis sp. TaxID=1931229 RepID=UPI00261BBA3C|nr:CARDB domain-containing protein [Halorientalis sp.]